MGRFSLHPILALSLIFTSVSLRYAFGEDIGLVPQIKVGEEAISKISVGDIEYVSLPRVIKGLRGEMWSVENKVVCLVPESTEASSCKWREIIFTLDSNLVIIEEKGLRISYPVIKQGEYILLPVSSLGQIFPGWQAASGEVPQAPVKEIFSVTSSFRRDTVSYLFEVDTSVNFYTQRLSPTGVEVTIGAKAHFTSITPVGIVREIKLSLTNETRANFYFKKPALFRYHKRENGIHLKFYPASNGRERMATVPAGKEGKLLIILDPGHGGKDPGAVGKLGTKEKDLNLNIARRLQKKLERAGYRVLLTREDDRFLSLSERTSFANRMRASLFISIHCNASRDNPRAIGFETYFLSEGRTDLERAQALKENEAIQFETNNPFLSDELSLILSDLAQNEFLRESEDLACAIQDAADLYLGLQNRGVKQAGFYVLRGALMPSVLVECGFLSNRREEKLLREEKTKERIAEAIFRGIKSFLAKYEEKLATREGIR